MAGNGFAVVGQIGRDLVLRIDAWPDEGGSAPVVERQELLGGKGANQAVALAQLGRAVALVGVVGDDPPGREVVRQAAADGIDTTGVVVRPGAVTALLVDVVAGGHRRLLEDVPEPALLTPADVEAAEPVLTGAEVVICQLQQPAEAVLAAQRIAHRAGGLVVVDGAPRDEGARAGVLAGADLLRADGQEAEILAGHPLDSLDDTVAAARELARGRTRAVVLAGGPAGNVVAWPGGHAVVPLVDLDLTGRERVDPTGAGDAFVAAFAVAVSRGDAPVDATRWAASASALSIGKSGGRPVLTPAAVDDLARRSHA